MQSAVKKECTIAKTKSDSAMYISDSKHSIASSDSKYCLVWTISVKLRHRKKVRTSCMQ